MQITPLYRTVSTVVTNPIPVSDCLVTGKIIESRNIIQGVGLTMMKIEDSRYPNIVYIEMDGELTQNDVENAEAFMDGKYGDDKRLSGLIYIKDVEGTDADAFLSGGAVDLKHWKQYEKFAFVSNQSWVDMGASVVDWLPGIEVQHFDKAEINKAWEWLQK